jgi:hypothetical protein
MPFRLCPKRKHDKMSRLESRVRRVENNAKAFVTWPELWYHWNRMTAGNGLLRRIGDLEAWHTGTDKMMAEFAKDLTIMESKLNGLLPLDDENDEDDGGDGGDKMPENSATATERSLSPEPFSYNNVGPHAFASKLSMSKLPTTFTRRSSGSTERTALDASSLRLF